MKYTVGIITHKEIKRGKKTTYLIKLRYLGEAATPEEAHQYLEEESIMTKIKSTSASWLQNSFPCLEEGIEIMKARADYFSEKSLKRKNLVLIGVIPW